MSEKRKAPCSRLHINTEHGNSSHGYGHGQVPFLAQAPRGWNQEKANRQTGNSKELIESLILSGAQAGVAVKDVPF